MPSERKYPPHEVLAKLESFCAYQERCTWEVRRKMADWGCDPDEMEEVLSDLIRKGFVDDERFADSFVSGKFRFKKWGRIKLKHELRSRKIPDDLIRKALVVIDGDVYLQTLEDLAHRKWSEIRGKDQWDRKAKLIRFLASKGFESDLISDVVSKLVSSE